MPKFLVTYHGGDGMPSDPAALQQVVAAFMGWAQSVGSAMVDPGAPLTNIKTLSSSGVSDGPAPGHVGGYTLLEADDMDTAVRLAEPHPFIKRGGSLQVSEVAAPPG
ncbi:MAG: hypothetical protein ACREN2_04925 [Candidatus Dormibacteria bacterium]